MTLEEIRERYLEAYEQREDEEALEQYFASCSALLDEALPSMIHEGKTREAFHMVKEAWCVLTLEDMGWWDPEWIEPAYHHFAYVIGNASSIDEKREMFGCFVSSLDDEMVPEYLHEVVTAVLLNCFNEDEFLRVLIDRTCSRMKTTQMEDIRDHSAGVLTDLYERLGGHEDDISSLKESYGKETGFLIALSDLWRWRGDRRCIDLLVSMRDDESSAFMFRESRREELEKFYERYGR